MKSQQTKSLEYERDMVNQRPSDDYPYVTALALCNIAVQLSQLIDVLAEKKS